MRSVRNTAVSVGICGITANRAGDGCRDGERVGRPARPVLPVRRGRPAWPRPTRSSNTSRQYFHYRVAGVPLGVAARCCCRCCCSVLGCLLRHTLPTIPAANKHRVPLNGTPIARAPPSRSCPRQLQIPFTGTTREYRPMVTAVTATQTFFRAAHLFRCWSNSAAITFGPGNSPTHK